MYISDLDADKLSDDQMTKLLFSDIQDDGQQGDCIFVAGSSKAVLYRLPKAVELYMQGRADRLLFSGGVTWKGSVFTEAESLQKEAITSGIPEDAILVEKQSLHTVENVLASMFVLNREIPLYKVRRILVVTTSYHMRRLHLSLQTYMPDWIEYSLCLAEDDNTVKDNWFLTELGRKRVQAECSKLIKYVQMGSLKDMSIEM